MDSFQGVELFVQFEEYWSIIGWICGAIYACTQIFFTLGLLKLKSSKYNHLTQGPSLSVVIPMRNEATNIRHTLEALYKQNYQSPFEIIAVNDRSTDQTAQIVQDFQVEFPLFPLKYLAIPLTAPEVLSPKKRALSLGFEHADGEILMTLDADCCPPAGWLSSMAAHFNDGMDIVQGPKKIRKPKGALEGYQALDTLGFTLIEGAFFAWKKPMLASAPSLAYRKSLYISVGGFNGLEGLISGDDDMLVHKMSQKTNRVTYNMDPYAQVATVPASTWKETLLQRARWSSNGTEYANKLYVALLGILFLFFSWCAFSPIFSILGWVSWQVTASHFLLKFLVDTLLIGVGAYKMKELKLLKWYVHAQIIQPYMIVLAVWIGQLKLYKWK